MLRKLPPVVLSVAALLVAAPVAHGFALREFRVSGLQSGPDLITPGLAGHMWLWTGPAGPIKDVDPAGKVTPHPLPETRAVGSIALDATGGIWFTTGSANELARLSPDGQLSRFTVDTNSGPCGLVVGSDGDLWFLDGSYRIVRLTPDGQATMFPLPKPANPPMFAIGPRGPVLGLDGRIWLVDGTSVDAVATDGTVSAYAAGVSPGPYAELIGVAPGPDGRMWVIANDGEVKRITTAGQVSSLAPNRALRNAAATAFVPMAAGSDGRMWMIGGRSLLLAVTPHGSVSSYGPGTLDYGFSSLARGTDGRLWVTESAQGRVAQITTGEVCAVPAFVGRSEAAARTAAKAAACRVHVVRPRGASGHLTVVSQSLKAGGQHGANTVVRVVLGHLRPACRVPHDAVVLARSSDVFVYMRALVDGDVATACLRRSGKLVPLPALNDGPDAGGGDDADYTLAGTRVAYADFGDTKYMLEETTIAVRDLTSSAKPTLIATHAAVAIDALALAATGPVAWIQRDYASGAQTLQVWLAGTTTTLDTSPSRALAGLTVDATSVHWTNAGVTKSAPVPAG